MHIQPLHTTKTCSPTPRTRQNRPVSVHVMKPTTIFSSLTALALASLARADADSRTAAIYIQPVGSSPSAPALLAEIEYDLSHSAGEGAAVKSYEAPDLSDDDNDSALKLVRVGAYDAVAKTWVSSTSVASVNNFSKGYAPHFLLSLGARGDVVSAAVKGVRIDAGQTRDFGPQVVVLQQEKGAQPELNRPVVLSPEGKKVVPEEKTFFQKYWWLIGIVVMLTMSGGGGEGK
ncbi:hypothetical protein F5Y15DRAFT_374838 [Xylariaceae sp. FL0016]|nr:hypothetical protein F5Y15DRAFT_374838 [Xylariaceae sp. FL0016]